MRIEGCYAVEVREGGRRGADRQAGMNGSAVGKANHFSCWPAAKSQVWDSCSATGGIFCRSGDDGETVDGRDCGWKEPNPSTHLHGPYSYSAEPTPRPCG
jgi:hypothetical protein